MAIKELLYFLLYLLCGGLVVLGVNWFMGLFTPSPQIRQIVLVITGIIVLIIILNTTGILGKVF